MPLEQAYHRFVGEFCNLPTVISECGKWLRVDRDYALNYFEAEKTRSMSDRSVLGQMTRVRWRPADGIGGLERLRSRPYGRAQFSPDL